DPGDAPPRGVLAPRDGRLSAPRWGGAAPIAKLRYATLRAGRCELPGGRLVSEITPAAAAGSPGAQGRPAGIPRKTAGNEPDAVRQSRPRAPARALLPSGEVVPEASVHARFRGFLSRIGHTFLLTRSRGSNTRTLIHVAGSGPGSVHFLTAPSTLHN